MNFSSYLLVELMNVILTLYMGNNDSFVPIPRSPTVQVSFVEAYRTFPISRVYI